MHEKKHIYAERLKHAVKVKATNMVRLNRSRTNFLEKLQQMIDEYNSGAINIEIFFDKLLLEEISDDEKKITYVVKANPIINDATIDDAEFAGIDKHAKVIAGDAGQSKSTPGMVLSYASKEFLELLKTSDMIISKGQGNYEALSDIDREVFFLLMVKCPLVANDIGTEMARLVLKVKE